MKCQTRFNLGAMKSIFIYMFLVLMIFPPQIFAQQKGAKKQKESKGQQIENKVFDAVYNVPEVKARVDEFDQQTKGKRHMQFMIAERPSVKLKYYWVKVMEDNEFNYATDFHFMVDPKSMEVKYYDVVNDTIIDLVTWRKRMKK